METATLELRHKPSSHTISQPSSGRWLADSVQLVLYCLFSLYFCFTFFSVKTRLTSSCTLISYGPSFTCSFTVPSTSSFFSNWTLSPWNTSSLPAFSQQPASWGTEEHSEQSFEHFCFLMIKHNLHSVLFFLTQFNIQDLTKKRNVPRKGNGMRGHWQKR